MPSYNCWATVIVLVAENPSRRDASCCSVLVMNGGAGRRFTWRVVTESTRYAAPSRFARTALVATSSVRESSSFSPARLRREAVNEAFSSVRSAASMDQYSTGTNASISLSRSATRRSATDCTRPAERELVVSRSSAVRMLRLRFSSCPTSGLSRGLSLKPTSLSSIRRACCALTSSMSMSRSWANASLMASSVIEWKTTRRTGLLRQPAASITCQAIASPSRSGSVAR